MQYRSRCFIVLASLAISTWHCEAGLISNGGFESGTFAEPGDANFANFGSGFTGTLILPGLGILDAWEISLSPFDPDGSLTFQPPDRFGLEWVSFAGGITGDGERFIDLNRGGDLFQVSQDIATILGRTYRLSYLAETSVNRGNALTEIQIAGNSTTTFEDRTPATPPYRWVKFSHTFVADSFSTRVSFAAKVPGNDPITGAQIDRVSVTEVVPEPTSLAIFGAIGLAGLVARRKRKQQP